MVTKDMLDFMMKFRQSGKTDTEITATLLANGWSQSDISEGFLAKEVMNDVTKANKPLIKNYLLLAFILFIVILAFCLAPSSSGGYNVFNGIQNISYGHMIEPGTLVFRDSQIYVPIPPIIVSVLFKAIMLFLKVIPVISIIYVSRRYLFCSIGNKKILFLLPIVSVVSSVLSLGIIFSLSNNLCSVAGGGIGCFYLILLLYFLHIIYAISTVIVSSIIYFKLKNGRKGSDKIFRFSDYKIVKIGMLILSIALLILMYNLVFSELNSAEGQKEKSVYEKFPKLDNLFITSVGLGYSGLLSYTYGANGVYDDEGVIAKYGMQYSSCPRIHKYGECQYESIRKIIYRNYEIIYYQFLSDAKLNSTLNRKGLELKSGGVVSNVDYWRDYWINKVGKWDGRLYFNDENINVSGCSVIKFTREDKMLSDIFLTDIMYLWAGKNEGDLFNVSTYFKKGDVDDRTTLKIVSDMILQFGCR